MRWLKYIGYFFLIVLILAAISYWMLDSSLPERTQDRARIEQLKSTIAQAVNRDAWEKTPWIQWNFPGGHEYLWDKTRHLVRVKYDDITVLLDPEAVDGQVSQAQQVLVGEQKQKHLDKAFAHFTNDAFWLAAPFMIDQAGTEHSIATTEDGREGLLVEYTSGGVTPGDHYLWILGDDGKPNAYQMWVKIIPVGGTEASWDNWLQLKSGAWIAQSHKIGPATLELTNIRDGLSFRDFGFTSDPFSVLVKKNPQRI